MRLINQSKNTILAEDVFIAKTFFSRIKGLLGRKNFLPGQALILNHCNCVHTFFMHFPIDLLFLDKDYKVIEALSEFKPNQISRIYWHANKVIELPAGVIIATGTIKNELIQIL